jgi:hypothetical protein
MDLKRITTGKRVGYKSRCNTGTGKVEKTYAGKTGHWVTIHDKARGAVVTVRPSQVRSA